MKSRAGDALFSFQLDFEEFQRCVVTAADQQAIGSDFQFGGRDGLRGRERFPDLKILAAKFRVGAGPGLESAEAIVDFGGRTGEVDQAIFFFENWGERGVRVVLLARLNGAGFAVRAKFRRAKWLPCWRARGRGFRPCHRERWGVPAAAECRRYRGRRRCAWWYCR